MLDEPALAMLKDLGLAGIEVDHQDHPPELRERLRGIAADLDLVATGSSDHHGLGKVDHDRRATRPTPSSTSGCSRWPATRSAAELPDRVLVYGVTGSGKSTAALAIGARTGHPVTLVDELTWLPGWVPVDGAVQRDLISEVVAGERWLLDSAYGAWLDLVLPHAELVVGLDYPRWLSLGRLVRRTVSAAITKEPRCNGNVETWRKVVARDSIIGWHFQSFARKRTRMRAWAASPDGPRGASLPAPA